MMMFNKRKKSIDNSQSKLEQELMDTKAELEKYNIPHEPQI